MIKTYILDTRALPDPADAIPRQEVCFERLEVQQKGKMEACTNRLAMQRTGKTGVCTNRLDVQQMEKMEACINGLPAQRMEKILRIRHPDVRKQSLGAGLLLHKVLGTLAPEAEMTYGSYGKPLCAGIPFNLSHTRGAAALSIWDCTDTAPGAGVSKEAAGCLIGCDIEQVRPYQPGVARRFFTEAEYQSLEAARDPQVQAEWFCRYWTRKESVMKLTGLGLSLPMNLYDVRGRQAAVDMEGTLAWYEKGMKKGQVPAEYRQAADILLHQALYFQEYRYRDCFITVCSVLDQFAPFYERLEDLSGL